MGLEQWNQFEVKFIPSDTIEAIMFYLDCENDRSHSDYMIVDNVIIRNASLDSVAGIELICDPVDGTYYLYSGLDSLGHQWYKDSIPLPKESNSRLELTYADQGTYYVFVSNEHTCKLLGPYALVPPVLLMAQDSFCQGTSYLFNDRVISQEGTYLDQYQGRCDTFLQLTLTEQEPFIDTIRYSLRINETVTFKNRRFEEAGIFDISVSGTNVCDSIFILIIQNASEICDNGIDDDGDGLIDCYDASCCGLVCQPDTFLILLDTFMECGFTAIQPNKTFARYLWNTGDSTTDISVNASGVYMLTVTDDCGNIGIGSQSIIVDSCIHPVVVIHRDTALCGGDSVLLGNHWISKQGVYYDTIQQNSLDSIFALYVSIHNPFRLSLPDTVKVNPDQTTDILLSGTIDASYAFQWEPATLATCSDCLQPGFQFTEAGKIQLLVSNNRCDTVLSSYVVLNKKDPTHYIPNVFSPNGDQVNDYFKVYGNQDDGLPISLSIFDRWGNRLYVQTASSAQLAWDGTGMDGNHLPPGVYVYQIRIHAEQEIKEYSGSITIIH